MWECLLQVRFSQDQSHITAMLSAEGESVELSTQVKVGSGGTCDIAATVGCLTARLALLAVLTISRRPRPA